MILKWICCEVADDMRRAFSDAQEAWSGIVSVQGFVAQVGGWDTRNTGRACILGLWKDLSSYQVFMREHHDGVVGPSRQSETYISCTTRILEPEFPLPGSSDDFVDALETASILRAARCVVRPEREGHFVNVQRDHWAPGMCDAGVLGGLFLKHDDGGSEYLVVTAWGSPESHDTYLREIFPSLRAASGVEEDVRSLDGSVIGMERRWRVIGGDGE